ncbi:MAG: hypothetical protein AVDCRST_MAG02-2531, partial [uncultured Rubrobacteraceae bacterium]
APVHPREKHESGGARPPDGRGGPGAAAGVGPGPRLLLGPGGRVPAGPQGGLARRGGRGPGGGGPPRL